MTVFEPRSPPLLQAITLQSVLKRLTTLIYKVDSGCDYV